MFFFCKNDAVEGGYSIPPSVPSFVDVFFCVGPPFANDRVDVDDQVAVLLAQVLALSHLCVCVCATLSPAIGFRPTIAEENRVETDWKKKQEDLELNFRLTDVIAIIECGVCGVCVRRFPCRRLDCVESTVDRSEQKLKIEIKNKKKQEERRREPAPFHRTGLVKACRAAAALSPHLPCTGSCSSFSLSVFVLSFF